MIAKASWISILITVILAGGLWWWWNQVQTVEVVHIEAPLDYGFSIPIYAQFTVGQTVKLHSLIRLTSINVPVWIPPNASGELIITIHRNQQLVARQRIDIGVLRPDPSRIMTLIVPVFPPHLIDDNLDIQFEAPKLDAHFPIKAPRVFVEADDQAFPDGNYRVAQNQKHGDVGLSAEGLQTNGEALLQLKKRQPAKFIERLTRWGLLAILLIGTPSAGTRRKAHTTPGTTA